MVAAASWTIVALPFVALCVGVGAPYGHYFAAPALVAIALTGVGIRLARGRDSLFERVLYGFAAAGSAVLGLLILSMENGTDMVAGLTYAAKVVGVFVCAASIATGVATARATFR